MENVKEKLYVLKRASSFFGVWFLDKDNRPGKLTMWTTDKTEAKLLSLEDAAELMTKNSHYIIEPV